VDTSAVNKKTDVENHFQRLPQDLHPTNCEYFPLKDLQSLSLTCKLQRRIYEDSWMHKLTCEGQQKINNLKSSVKEPLFLHARQLFLDNPQYRIERFLLVDQKGIDYLQNELQVNCGPLTIQKIRKGELTIAQAKEQLEDKEQKIKLLKEITKLLKERADEIFDEGWEELSLESVVKYMMDGSLTKEEVVRNIVGGDVKRFIIFCTDKGAQKYVDNGTLEIIEFDDYLTTFSELYSILNNNVVQKSLDDGPLKSTRTNSTTRLALNCLYYYDAIQREPFLKYVSNGQLIAEDLIDFIARFERTVDLEEVLKSANVQKYLDSGKLSMNSLCKFYEIVPPAETSNPEILWSLADALTYKGVQKYFEKGELTIVQLFDLLESAKGLDGLGIQKLLDNRQLTMEQVISLLKLSGFMNILTNTEYLFSYYDECMKEAITTADLEQAFATVKLLTGKVEPALNTL
jgi:hypothetical protein